MNLSQSFGWRRQTDVMGQKATHRMSSELSVIASDDRHEISLLKIGAYESARNNRQASP
jgi:hypothetical protein